jgi:type VII secretion integral membrane protein EccD
VTELAVVAPLPEPCKIALLVGDKLKEFVVPAVFPVSAITGGLVRNLKEQRLLADGEPTAYRLCWAENSIPLNPLLSLDDSGVRDGAMLSLLPVKMARQFAGVCEDISAAAFEKANAKTLAKADAQTWQTVAIGTVIGSVAAAELLLSNLWWHTHSWVPATVSWMLAVALFWVWRKTAQTDGFGWAAIIAASAGAAMTIPGPPGPYNLVAAVGAGLAGLILLVIITGRYTTISAAASVVGLCAAAVGLINASGWHVLAARLAVGVLLCLMLLATWAPHLGARGSGVPGPWFPSIINRGMFTVEKTKEREQFTAPVRQAPLPSTAQIALWGRRANQIMTGIVAGVAVLLAPAAWFATLPYTPGGWRFTVFAVGSCWAIGFNSRIYRDRWCAVLLAGGAAVAMTTIIARFAAPEIPATLVCTGLILTVGVFCWLTMRVLPKAKISAPINKAIELTELVFFLLLAAPWAFALSGLWSVLRNLVHAP